MTLDCIGHTDVYAVEQLQLSLLGQTPGEAVSQLNREDGVLEAVTTITIDGKTQVARKIWQEEETVSARRRLLQQSYYEAALPFLKEPPQWGALAGVRPTKLTTKMLLQGMSSWEAAKMMTDMYYVSKERSDLAVMCSSSTVQAIEKLDENDVSVYVGIPFCPTRCAYCSFVSRSIGKQTDLIAPYLEALLQEIEETGKLLRQYGKTVRTLYIGGGTPTTLTAAQLQKLMEKIRDCVDLSRCAEYTVEGGRPDTLTHEKLEIIFRMGADRISINPQSMDDAVLKASGRPHTAQKVVEQFQDAKAIGFTDINMDLIAGLPKDTYEGFCRSLDAVAALAPSNITVHTLALKKGADLFDNPQKLPSQEEVAHMVNYANKTLSELGYRPYYLYRQKYMSGSFENVGWAKNDRPCLYNIYMMEEIHPIVSLGAGGMNKVNLPGGKLERFHNPKFPEQYIGMLPQVLEDKKTLFKLMGTTEN